MQGKILALFLFLCIACRATAQDDRLPDIRLQNGQSPAWHLTNDPAALQGALPVGVDTALAWVEIPGGAAANQQIGSVRIIRPLRQSVYLARIGRTSQLPPQIRAFAVLTAAQKISAALQPLLTGPGNARIGVLIETDAAHMPALRNHLAAAGATIASERMAGLGFLEVAVEQSKIAGLAALPDVLSVGRKGQISPLNFVAKYGTQAANAAMPVSAGGYGLRGEGVTIGIGDDSHGTLHVDTRDRVINYMPFANNPFLHGCYVTGTAGSAGIMWDKAEGFAPAATLINHASDNVWLETDAMRTQHGMIVTNNSYGQEIADCDYAGTYDGYSQTLDQVTLNNPDVLHVFAAGNDGAITCGAFPTAYATVLGGYQSSKNALMVGNMKKDEEIHFTSSRGPVQDGRLKPEIVAFGTTVLSTSVNDNYGFSGGTSSACPNVSGSAALLAQRYRQLNAGANPPSDLSKALLLCGTTDLGALGPDYTYGFGKLNLMRSLALLDSGWHTANDLADGAQQDITVNVPAGVARLKVMLYYHDLPGTGLSGVQLVNDLDLEVLTPASVVTRPLILNPAPASVANAATQGADHRNNAEQVVIETPAAGTYTIRVKGYSVTSPTQHYVVAYDMEPDALRINYPMTAATAVTGDSLLVYWEAPASPNGFTLEWRPDPGTAWSTISAAIPADARVWKWTVPSINSQQCQMRLSRTATAQTFTTGEFILNDSLKLAVSAAGNQCPGSMRIDWQAVPNATGYEVLLKQGAGFVQIATTAALTYTVSGLNVDSFYYMAVRPLVNGVRGQRSLGVRRRPNTGTCTLGTYDFNLSLERILAPTSGRVGTSTALTAATTLSVRVRNQDNLANTNYAIAYSINAAAWVTTAFTGVGNQVVGNSTRTVNVLGLNLLAPGTYNIRVTVINNAGIDPVKSNDTLQFTVRQLVNPVMTLTPPDLQDFESLPELTIVRDSLGFTTDERWDFISSRDTGRLRTFVTSPITITGSRSVSMDNLYHTGIGAASIPSLNQLRATYNLSSFSTATDEIRVSFDYRIHSPADIQDSNRVYLRGTDAGAYVPIFNFPLGADAGVVYNSGSLSLSAALLAAGQNFSSSTQVSINQFDTGAIATAALGAGITIDNIRLEKVDNDADISRIAAPLGSACAPGAAQPVSVWVRNRVSMAQTSVPVTFVYDGGTPVTETIPSIPGNDSVLFTFVQTIDASAPGLHQLVVYVKASGDTYADNDTARLPFRSLPLIATFPYLQDFEASDGYFFAEGLNSSWAHTTPASIAIPDAASGVKAWKTNHIAAYQDNEESYLYTPCFNTSGLATPRLSFSLALDLNDCSPSVCDYAYVEYSTDGGATWPTLGAFGDGTNWYNHPGGAWVWSNATPWHVATIPVPAVSAIRFRFVFATGSGVIRDGLAIDDIHVYDRTNPIYTGADVGPLTATPSGSAFTSFTSGGAVAAQINPQGHTLGSTNVYLYNHSNPTNLTMTQYLLPRSFAVNSASTPADSVIARFFVTDANVDSLLAASTCPTCSRPRDVYRLGISQYDDATPANINNSLVDNNTGTYTFFPYTSVKWVPYDAGYYAEIQTPHFSEFWFNNGGLSGGVPLPVSLISFAATATANDPATALLEWTAAKEPTGLRYALEASPDGLTFAEIFATPAQPSANGRYSHTHRPTLPASSLQYYRLRMVDADGSTAIGPVRMLRWSATAGAGAAITVFPNPVKDGAIRIAWPATWADALDVAVLDVTGKTWATAHIRHDAGQPAVMAVPQLPTGLYTIRLNAAGRAAEYRKVVVTNK